MKIYQRCTFKKCGVSHDRVTGVKRDMTEVYELTNGLESINLCFYTPFHSARTKTSPVKLIHNKHNDAKRQQIT